MKKIIGGKKYDTDTAKRVGSFESGYIGDFEWRHEELYLKATSEFFLAGEGGAKTRWASRTIDGYSSGEGILPLTLDEAREWAEEHLTQAEVEELFQIPKEEVDSGKKIQSFSIAPKTINGLRYLAQNLGISRSEIIDQLVAKAVETAGVPKEA